MAERLRAVIVGTGMIGAVHRVAALRSGAEVIGVVGSTPSRGREAAEAWNVPRAFDDLRGALAVRPDVVHVCSPNALHVEHALQAIHAGTSVICEKPLATSVADAARMVEAAAGAGVMAAVPFVYRYHPMVREIRARVSDGQLGDLLLVHGSYLQDWLHSPTTTSWRVDVAAGGSSRAFADIGSHWSDLVEFVTGERFERVSALTQVAYPKRPATAGASFAAVPGAGGLVEVATEDVAVATFQTSRGVPVSTTISQVSADRKNRLWFQVDGSLGSAVFDQEQPELAWSGARDGLTLVRRARAHSRRGSNGSTSCHPATRRDTQTSSPPLSATSTRRSAAPRPTACRRLRTGFAQTASLTRSWQARGQARGSRSTASPDKGSMMTEFTVSPQEFRRALAHYPTGVAVVIARGPDGSPVSMVVGTFTSVSLDPPLVGFLADHKSSSWPKIREAGHFCVSVLGAGHEHVCRAFATKDPDRFNHATTLTESGCPRLDEATLWVDCLIEDVLAAGDHDFALGRVRQLGVGEERGLPLLFLRGGYGAPRIASLQVEAPGLGPILRLADAVRPEIELVARELGLESIVLARVDGQVVMVAAAGIESTAGSSRTHVGSAFPLAAPLAPVFLAWAGPEDQRQWLAEGARLAGEDVTEVATAALDAVRARGHEITTGRDVSVRFRQVVLGESELAAEQEPAEFGEVVRAVVGQRDPALALPLEHLSDVTALMVPVRESDGRVVLSLGVIGFTGKEDPARLQQCLRRLERAAYRATELLAGLPAA